MGDADYTSQQRAAVVMLHLSGGKQLRTADVMRLVGLRRSGALKLLGHLSGLRECAVYEVEPGLWGMLGREEAGAAGQSGSKTARSPSRKDYAYRC